MTATVHNVNEGAHPGLAQACKALAGYSHLVALVREGRHNGLGVHAAVHDAVGRCIEEGILADYLLANRAEVSEMFLYEFDEELHNRTLREEGHEEGREEERARTLGVVASMVSRGLLSFEDAVAEFGFAKDELSGQLAELAGGATSA